MATVLQQTLRNLCFRTGWCYAVFWKLKRRSRMVLTWEDGYYEYSRSNWSSVPTRNSCAPGGDVGVETGGNPLEQRAYALEVGFPEGQIGLAVAKMACCVYSMGEGIIGRVAFTNKHQWVFAGEENNCDESNSGGILSSRCMLEKYPAGWQNQFAAGIKTIAVVAVPQGVVQLGSTETMVEDVQLVDRIRSVFGTLQNVSGAFLSDFLLEGQGGKSAQSMPVVSVVSPSAAVRRTTALDTSHFPLGNIKGTNATGIRLISSGSRVVPALVKGSLNLPALHSIYEVSEASKESFQGSQLQPVDGQGSQPAVVPSASQTLQGCITVMQSDVPPTRNAKPPLPCVDMTSGPFAGLKDIQVKNNHLQDYHKLSSMVVGTGAGSEGDVSSGLQDCVHPDASCIRELLNVSGIPVSGKASDFHRNESLMGVPSVNRLVEQKLEVSRSSLLTPLGGHNSGVSVTIKKQLPQQNDSTSLTAGLSSSKLLNNDVGNEFSNNPVEDDLSTQECLRDVPHTSLIRSAKRLKSDCFDGVGITATFEDSLCSIAGQNVWDKEGLLRSTSSCVSQSTVGDFKKGQHGQKDLEWNTSTVGKEILATSGLDDFEKYMDSLSKGQSVKWDCSFAIGDELSQALGPAFRKRHGKEFWEEVLLHSSGGQLRDAPSEQMVGRNCVLSEQNKAEVFQNWGSDFMNDNSNRGLFCLHYIETKSEPLLDAVVANASSGQHSISTSGNDSFSCKPANSGLESGMSVLNNIKEEESKCAGFSVSHDSLSKGYVQAMTECKVDAHNVNQVVDAKGHLNLPMSSDWSLKRMLNPWTEEGQSVKSDNTQPSQLKKSEELTKSNRKRAKPGESTRPRPKDRQQIQDRVRELRDIVPNGSKCSIDALLEKTIKHMLFLQSVTLHAENLKKTTELKDGMESGASWALELDGQGCPIHVEDLNQPRQMLVQMICDDRGLFLEIADIIRKLGLTILKGVMESRTDKIWARFVVEGDVQRVQIVYSLMQVLPLNNNSSSSSMTMASQSGPVRP